MGQVVSAKVRGPVTATGLTAKQEAFVRAVVLDGLNFTAAYRVSHCAGDMAPATVWVKASALAKTDKVRARISELQTELERRTYDDAERMRALVIERLWAEALNARQDGARIRAVELLGKTIGIFTERREIATIDVRSAEDITADLVARLTALLGTDLGRFGA